MLNILHCADLHLDSPFTDSLHKGDARRAKLRAAFVNLIHYAAEHSIPLVLLCGDLFDSAFVTKETVSLLCREMEAVPSCRFVIAPGNHDPFTKNSVYAQAQFPSNVFIFSSEEPTCFSFDDLGVDVYGYAFTSATLDRAPLAALPSLRKDRINLFCAHADLSSPLSPYAPVSRDALAASGMDYIALGHIHACSGLQKAGDTYYAYCGCLEGRGFDELGYKGALSLQISKENGILQVIASEKRFSFGRYEIKTLDLTGACTLEQALSTIQTALREEKLLGADTSLRLILTGYISPSVLYLQEQTRAALSDLIYALEIVDRTVPLLDAEKLAGDMTVRGAFYRRLLPLLESEDEATRTRGARALTLGLAALSDQSVIKEFNPPSSQGN